MGSWFLLLPFWLALMYGRAELPVHIVSQTHTKGVLQQCSEMPSPEGGEYTGVQGFLRLACQLAF